MGLRMGAFKELTNSQYVMPRGDACYSRGPRLMFAECGRLLPRRDYRSIAEH